MTVDSDRRLEELLVREGMTTVKGLRRARMYSHATGKCPWHALVDLEMATEEELVLLLAEQCQLSVLDTAGGIKPDIQLARRMGPWFCCSSEKSWIT